MSKSGKSSNNKTSNEPTIWVSGLSSKNVKASELQNLFSKYGTVISCKIITNPRLPGSSCYGFITMEDSKQVNECINHLNKTEFNGNKILLSKVSFKNHSN